jgi:hypothetical protein
VLALAAVIVTSVEVSAHRKDEYLQAARVDIGPGAVHLELNLTPGIALADAIIADIDRNRDGAFSPDEQRDYRRVVLSALTLAVDGTRVRAGVLGSEFPDVEAIKRGEGTIRMQLAGSLPRLSAGSHQLLFRNRHSPDRSVYLANALVPRTADVEVTAQRRDDTQMELTVDYLLRVEPPSPAPMWAMGGLTLAVALSALLMRTFTR